VGLPLKTPPQAQMQDMIVLVGGKAWREGQQPHLVVVWVDVPMGLPLA